MLYISSLSTNENAVMSAITTLMYLITPETRLGKKNSVRACVCTCTRVCARVCSAITVLPKHNVTLLCE